MGPLRLAVAVAVFAEGVAGFMYVMPICEARQRGVRCWPSSEGAREGPCAPLWVKPMGKGQPQTPPPNEFSRLMDLDDVSRKPQWMRIEAKEEEREALADRFEFLNLQLLRANVSVCRLQWGTLLAKGSLEAQLDRNCIVTGEQFPFVFTTEFSTYIKEVGGAVPLPGRYDYDDDEDGAVDEDMYDDEIEAGTPLDVGEIVAQYLYLNMPAYVTLPGKSMDDIPDEVVLELDDGNFRVKPAKSKPSW